MPVGNGATFHLTGESKAGTVIVRDTVVSENIYGFKGATGSVSQPSPDMIFENLTLQGPADPGPNSGAPGYNYIATAAIRSPQYSGSVTLNSVNITGKWFAGVDHQAAPAGGSSLSVTGCDITAQVIAILAENELANAKTITLNDNYYRNIGYIDGSGAARGEVLYIDPNQTFSSENDRFVDNTCKYNYHFYRTTEVEGSPQYCRIITPEFSNCYKAAILTNPWILTEITSPVINMNQDSGFDTYGIVPRGDVTVTNPYISAKYGIYPIDSLLSAGSTFTINGGGQILNSLDAVILSIKIIQWTFNSLLIQSPSQYGIYGNLDGGSVRVDINGGSVLGAGLRAVNIVADTGSNHVYTSGFTTDGEINVSGAGVTLN